jgi:hypothetical protein
LVKHQPIEEDPVSGEHANQAHTNVTPVTLPIRNKLTDLANSGRYFEIEFERDVDFEPSPLNEDECIGL